MVFFRKQFEFYSEIYADTYSEAGPISKVKVVNGLQVLTISQNARFYMFVIIHWDLAQYTNIADQNILIILIFAEVVTSFTSN